MVLDGLTLTVIGMSVVFLFLILLVIVMKVLSAMVHKYLPEKEVLVQVSAAGNTEIAVAIAAAAAFRQR